MASKAMWEVDPETRSKLAAIQKKEGAGNDKCCDCGAPSPQWASPKFSTFICLQCAGTHRGLGVHVSFVRSISMDAFKQNEILRMQFGGNKAFQDFYNKNSATSFEESTIKERYDCEVGEEWKERLTCQVEERPFNKDLFLNERQAILERQASRSQTPSGVGRVAASNSNVGSRTQSPAPAKQGLGAEQKSRNEAYFERMGAANSSRPDGVAPSQGGKYAGFGSAMPESPPRQDSSMPSTDEFQKDPLGALTKGFGWFGSALTKQAKMVNDSYIQPTAKNIAATDFAAQARQAALTAGQGIQSGAKGAAESFNKFVEGQDDKASAAAGKRTVEPEKKDFWESFGQASDAPKPSKPSSVGTSAMKGKVNEKKKEDGWGTEDW